MNNKNEKRRDSRGRLLRENEIQEKSGRYRYRYIDLYEDLREVYSWKLDVYDKTPEGKRDGLSLREKEKEIQVELFNQRSPNGSKLTVKMLVERYVSLKIGVRPSTKASYRTVIRILEKDDFGRQKIDKVNMSDAKTWLVEMQKSGRGFSTIRTIRGVLRPAFRMALDDDLIRKNPFEFELCEVIYNDSVTREALTREDERKFLAFISGDKYYCRYYDGIFILLNTGLRISEFCGLTINDIDFKSMKINVDYQLVRYTGIGYRIEDTKTEAGHRMVPMTSEVAECFKRIIKMRKKLKVEPMIDGMTGFLFLDKDDHPMVAMHWEKYFQHIVEKYNSIYKAQLPKITPHVCRHTFCSRMAAARMNPKTLQYIMGHSDISVTLNTYTHVEYDDVANEFVRVSDIRKKVQVYNCLSYT